MDSDKWVAPIFNEEGITQWGWRVRHKENLKLGELVRIGSYCGIASRTIASAGVKNLTATKYAVMRYGRIIISRTA